MTIPSPDSLLGRMQEARRNGDGILLRNATIVPVDPSTSSFAGDLLIQRDRIIDLGPDLGPAGGDVVEVDLTGQILIPGLIDSHVHAWAGQLRGIAPHADFGTYMSVVHGQYGTRYTPEDIAIGQRLTAAHALNGGITTIVDNSHNVRTPAHAEAGIEALRDSGIRAVHAMSAPTTGQSDSGLPQDLVRLRDEFASGSDSRVTLRVFDVLFDVPSSLGLWRFALEHGFSVSAELGMWVPDIPALVDSGLMGPSFAFNHCTGLDEATWRAIAESGAAVNLAPRSDVQYGLGGFSPVLEAQRHGVRHGISSDNETAYGLDLFSEMRTLLAVQNGLAWGVQFSGGEAPERYTSADVLRAATSGGALNAGKPESIGRLAPGMKADLVAVTTEHPTTRSAGDPETAVVQFAGVGDVEAVFVDGEVRKWTGVLVGIDEAALARDGERSLTRLREQEPA